MDAQTIRRAVFDLFRFNPKDFYVQGSPTGYLVSAAKASRAPEPPCHLKLVNVSADDSNLISVRWGTINGRQPSGFDTRGLVEPFEVGSDTTYFYAVAVASGGVWVSSEIIASDNPFISNDATTAYRMIGSVEVTDGAIVAISFTCGDVDFAICDLNPLG